MKQLDDDQKLASCPYCTYFEIWPKLYCGMDRFFCRDAACRKISCVHCYLKMTEPNINGYRDSELAALASDNTSFFYHMKCAELFPYKVAFEAAITEGTSVTCPGC